MKLKPQRLYVKGDLNTPQDSELGQPPGNGHDFKRSPEKKSTAKPGGREPSDALTAAVSLPEESSSPFPAAPASYILAKIETKTMNGKSLKLHIPAVYF
ncbi:hypothetical protein EK904_004123 [Melospiza melodia maxima]|nr:hypothetical protein EK904_004123 [Melospiza melodia maxima]